MDCASLTRRERPVKSLDALVSSYAITESRVNRTPFLLSSSVLSVKGERDLIGLVLARPTVSASSSTTLPSVNSLAD